MSTTPSYPFPYDLKKKECLLFFYMQIRFHHNIDVLKQYLVLVVFELYHLRGSLVELIFHTKSHITRIYSHC